MCNSHIEYMPPHAQQVGSIQFTAELGQTYVKGDELGFFAFGGSTCIAIFQKDSVVVDEDIISNRLAPSNLLQTDPKCSLLETRCTADTHSCGLECPKQ